MRTFYFGKIIRDKIIAAMELEECVVEHRPLAGEERRQKLIEKLREEANELADADSFEDFLEELADVQAVIDALVDGLSDDDSRRLKELNEAKLDRKGDFNNAIWVESISVPEDSDWIAYFESKPDKYPEQH